MSGDIFSLVLCDFHTVKWCKESIYMVHIKWTLWILIYVVCKKIVFCRKLILKALFRFNGTSKPSLTIALKILKTIEKPLISMVGPSKNIQWWWSNVVKTIEVNGGLKKNINHSIALKNWPSSWSNQSHQWTEWKSEKVAAAAAADILKKRFKTHSGEKSNKCNQCDYACSEPSALKNHLKTPLRFWTPKSAL